MSVEIAPQTLEPIESRMKAFGFDSADDLVEAALSALAERDGEDFEVDPDGLDDETRAAIQRADEQIARGEVLPREQVKAELTARSQTK